MAFVIESQQIAGCIIWTTISCGEKDSNQQILHLPNTLALKSFEVGTFFLCFGQKSHEHKRCIYLIKNSKNSNFVIYFYNFKYLLSLWLYFKLWFLSCYAKLNSSIQCHMILQKSFRYAFIIINVETVVLLNIFVKTEILYFRILWWTKFKRNRL